MILMTSGVPGGDSSIDADTAIGTGTEAVMIRWFINLIRLGIYLVLPPLAIYKDPFRGIWSWRKIYLVFLIGTGLVFLPSVLTGDLRPLLLFPLFHLIVAALLAEIFLAMTVPDLSVSLPSISSFAPMPVLMLTLAAAVAVIYVVFRGSDFSLSSISLPLVGDDEEPEYNIELTEVWKSGGKHE